MLREAKHLWHLAVTATNQGSEILLPPLEDQNDSSTMTKRETNLWQGIDPAAQSALTPRDYRTASFAQELAQRGVDAGELFAADKKQREIKAHTSICEGGCVVP